MSDRNYVLFEIFFLVSFAKFDFDLTKINSTELWSICEGFFSI